MRRILLDQGLALAAAAFLRADGWDALHVLDAGLDRAGDLQILEFACRESRVCITLDHDFHTHLALAQMRSPSVILVRLEGLCASDQAALIRRVWGSYADDLEAGAAISVDAVSIRVRKLPLR